MDIVAVFFLQTLQFELMESDGRTRKHSIESVSPHL